MIWQENKIIDITTLQVIYFEPTKVNIINRICDELSIDLFPSQDFNSFYSRKDNSWLQYELEEKQKLQYDINVFNSLVIEKLHASPSNILFVFERNAFKGVLHFTDFSKNIIYETLFRNFFEFEKSLKQYLINKGYDYNKFIDYFNYKAARETSGSNNRQNIEAKIDRINKYREYSPNLDLLTLLELLLFTISKFHTQPLINFDKSALLSSDKNKGTIDALRNMVMHSRDNSGMTEALPHNFERFKELFFRPVLDFKTAFSVLQEQFENESANKRLLDNSKLLDYLNLLDSNQLRDKFILS